MAMSIFELRTSVEEDRPFHLRIVSPPYEAEEQRIDFAIMRGKEGYDPADWTPPELVCVEPGATEWDYFGTALDAGVFSQRAIDVLKPHLERCFLPLPCTLEGERYYSLHIKERLDCLDIKHSNIVYWDDLYDDESHDIMDIKRYTFYKDRIADPLIFAIPEDPVGVFTTESIPEIVERAGLKGFRFLLRDGS